MIQFETRPLPDGQAKNLRSWLDKGELSVLRNVVESRLKAEQVKALHDAVIAKDHVNYFASANENMIAAQRYATFLEVLDDILKGDWWTVTLS